MKRTKDQLLAGVQHIPQKSSEIGRETSFKPEYKPAKWAYGFWYTQRQKLFGRK